MTGSFDSPSRNGKANPRVRLFLCLGLAGMPLALPAADVVPERWSREILDRRQADRDPTTPTIPGYEREFVAMIRGKILAQAREKSPAFADYRNTIPSNGADYEMIAIEGGTFTMGSPDEEPGRKDNEVVRTVTVSPFWIARTETTWGQFLSFAWRKEGNQQRDRTGAPTTPSPDQLLHWVSSPTQPYAVPDFGMGLEDDHPAISMTQHAANKFCQWLSLQTGHFYRLPTEAEWEYACRAGTTGPYSCPATELADHAVFDPDFKRTGYERVATKKPNPWGLFDMHGNVMEWCLDGYTSVLPHREEIKDPWIRAKQRYPCVVRGGSWCDTAESARSAWRGYSHPNWNIQDPQIPQSLWWLVDAQWLGFRIVRPLHLPSEEDMFEAWNTGAMHLEENDVIPDPVR